MRGAGPAATEQAERVADRLTTAVTEMRQRDALLRRLAAVDRQLTAAEEVLARTARTVERAGGNRVARLEALSLPRLLASLRGSRATALDRERAARKRAEYSHAVVVASRDALATDQQLVQQALAALDGVEDRYRGALKAREAWLASCAGDDWARGLVVTAHRRGRARALESEVQQAIERGREALESLARARSALSSADSWSSVDVFAGGGFLADSDERTRMDAASRQLHRAETALRRFVRELAGIDPSIDVHPGVGVLELDLTMTVLDTVFDNIFTDGAVRIRLSEPGGREGQVQRTLRRAVAGLENQLMLLRFERHTLDERHRTLLAALAGLGEPAVIAAATDLVVPAGITAPAGKQCA